MTKIDIFSGFLGAGKTTLIKKLIAEAYAGEKLVLIENEFGEINIDGGFLKESGIEISEMSAGCICCSLVGDFNKALREVVEQFHPDRILIEPSGVGKLSDVIVAVERTVDECPELKLNSYVTVADASKVKVYMKNFGEFYNNQIEAAGTIILSRTQKLSQEKLEAAAAMLREHEHHQHDHEHDEHDEHDHEHEHHHDHDEDDDHDEHEHHHEHDHDDHEHHHHHHDGEECDDPACECHHHHHHADDVFSSWGKETPKLYSKAALDDILTKLDSGDYGHILRAKGIVNGEGGWLEFDYVPEEHEVRAGHPDYTGRLCVIGAELKEDKLAELFGL